MKFERVKETYTNEEKLELAELVEKYKREYDAVCENNKGKTKWNSRRKNMYQLNQHVVSLLVLSGNFSPT